MDEETKRGLMACLGKELVSVSSGGDVAVGMYRLHFQPIAVCSEACCKGDDTETTMDIFVTAQNRLAPLHDKPAKGFLG